MAKFRSSWTPTQVCC